MEINEKTAICPSCGAKGFEGDECEYCGNIISIISRSDKIKGPSQKKDDDNKVFIYAPQSLRTYIRDVVKDGIRGQLSRHASLIVDQGLASTIDDAVSEFKIKIRRVIYQIYRFEGSFEGAWTYKSKSGNIYGNYSYLYQNYYSPKEELYEFDDEEHDEEDDEEYYENEIYESDYNSLDEFIDYSINESSQPWYFINNEYIKGPFRDEYRYKIDLESYIKKTDIIRKIVFDEKKFREYRRKIQDKILASATKIALDGVKDAKTTGKFTENDEYSIEYAVGWIVEVSIGKYKLADFVVGYPQICIFEPNTEGGESCLKDIDYIEKHCPNSSHELWVVLYGLTKLDRDSFIKSIKESEKTEEEKRHRKELEDKEKEKALDRKYLKIVGIIFGVVALMGLLFGW